MATKQLINYLDEHQVSYSSIVHPLAYTAQEIAALTHIPGDELAKTVIVKLDGQLVMVVLSANRKVDLEMLRQVSGAQSVEMATENEFRDRFADCELGAMPPFGNLYGLSVIADDELPHASHIAFNAGSHSELIKMDFDDFQRWANPTVMHVARA